MTHSQVQTYSITGTVTVSNGGGVPVTGVDVTDSLPGAVIDCGGGQSTGLTVPANSAITCSYAVTPGSEVTSNTAMASWGMGSAASGTASVQWSAPTQVGGSFVLRDSNGMAEWLGLGDLPDNNNTSTTRKYDETWTCAKGTASPNSGRTNTATVTWDGGSDSDSASVQVGCGSTPPPPPPDVCPNIDGTQAEVPEGMVKDGQGNCVTPPPPPTDVCPNIEGNQATVPAGMVKDGQGNCVTPPPRQPTPTTPPTDEFMDVQVVKDATPQVQLVNGQADIAYTMRVRNNGPNQAHTVKLVDAAPSGVTFLAVTQQLSVATAP